MSSPEDQIRAKLAQSMNIPLALVPPGLIQQELLGQVTPFYDAATYTQISVNPIAVALPPVPPTPASKPEVVKPKPIKLKPTVSFDSVVLSNEKREEIKAAISQVDNTNIIFDEWGFGSVFEKGTAITLLFYGSPGTGKTLASQAIAEELGAELKVYGMAEIGSSEPGGSERFIKKIFEEAKAFFTKEKRHRVVLFDECDALLYDRNKVGVILGAQINTLLTEIERHDGIIIFTTNRIGTLDPALERRIAAKIEFPFPDKTAREAIWKRMIPKQAPLAKDVQFGKLAEYKLAGGNIKNAVLNAARMAAYKKQKTITMNNFIVAIEKEEKAQSAFTSPKTTNEKNGWSTKAATEIGEGYGMSDDRSISVHQSLNSKYDMKMERKEKDELG